MRLIFGFIVQVAVCARWSKDFVDAMTRPTTSVNVLTLNQLTPLQVRILRHINSTANLNLRTNLVGMNNATDYKVKLKLGPSGKSPSEVWVKDIVKEAEGQLGLASLTVKEEVLRINATAFDKSYEMDYAYKKNMPKHNVNFPGFGTPDTNEVINALVADPLFRIPGVKTIPIGNWYPLKDVGSVDALCQLLSRSLPGNTGSSIVRRDFNGTEWESNLTKVVETLEHFKAFMTKMNSQRDKPVGEKWIEEVQNIPGIKEHWNKDGADLQSHRIMVVFGMTENDARALFNWGMHIPLDHCKTSPEYPRGKPSTTYPNCTVVSTDDASISIDNILKDEWEEKSRLFWKGSEVYVEEHRLLEDVGVLKEGPRGGRLRVLEDLSKAVFAGLNYDGSFSDVGAAAFAIDRDIEDYSPSRMSFLFKKLGKAYKNASFDFSSYADGPSSDTTATATTTTWFPNIVFIDGELDDLIAWHALQKIAMDRNKSFRIVFQIPATPTRIRKTDLKRSTMGESGFVSFWYNTEFAQMPVTEEEELHPIEKQRMGVTNFVRANGWLKLNDDGGGIDSTKLNEFLTYEGEFRGAYFYDTMVQNMKLAYKFGPHQGYSLFATPQDIAAKDYQKTLDSTKYITAENSRLYEQAVKFMQNIAPCHPSTEALVSKLSKARGPEARTYSTVDCNAPGDFYHTEMKTKDDKK